MAGQIEEAREDLRPARVTALAQGAILTGCTFVGVDARQRVARRLEIALADCGIEMHRDAPGSFGIERPRERMTRNLARHLFKAVVYLYLLELHGPLDKKICRIAAGRRSQCKQLGPELDLDGKPDVPRQVELGHGLFLRKPYPAELGAPEIGLERMPRGMGFVARCQLIRLRRLLPLSPRGEFEDELDIGRIGHSESIGVLPSAPELGQMPAGTLEVDMFADPEPGRGFGIKIPADMLLVAGHIGAEEQPSGVERRVETVARPFRDRQPELLGEMLAIDELRGAKRVNGSRALMNLERHSRSRGL